MPVCSLSIPQVLGEALCFVNSNASNHHEETILPSCILIFGWLGPNACNFPPVNSKKHAHTSAMYPYAPCMVYLSTCGIIWMLFRANVCKYSSTMKNMGYRYVQITSQGNMSSISFYNGTAHPSGSSCAATTSSTLEDEVTTSLDSQN